MTRHEVRDPESGALLFWASTEALCDCSGPGRMDEVVRDYVDSEDVRWAGTDEDGSVLRAFLRRAGYDPEELATWSKEELRERTLWVGAGDFRQTTLERIEELRRDSKLGGPGLDGHAYRAALYCVDCAHDTIDQRCNEARETLDTEALESGDTEDLPVPVFFGESDHAEHCDSCGEYLYGPLPGDEE